MDEDETKPQEEPVEPEVDITPQKMARLKNLKAFHGWNEDAIRDYMKHRPKKDEAPPKLFQSEEGAEENFEYDEAEYKKRYDLYYKRYLKEYGVDMNDANDAQALQALVRLVIQSEYADININKVQRMKNFDARTLKNMGDFQRSVQTSITELQDRLGISRKSRKASQADDIPQYIRALQTKAAEFWKRQTVAIQCNKCHIELARIWYNFPDRVKSTMLEIKCDKCKEQVIYSG